MSFEDERQTTVGFEDLMAEEDEVFTRETTLRTGINQSRIVERERKPAENPNAVRWLFNPFEVIDLRNEGASCGIHYLENVVFNSVKSIQANTAKADAVLLPGEGHRAENYDQFPRTALMISLELCNKNGDKGVIDLNLNGMSPDEANFINTTLFGDEVVCSFDVNNPDFPVPVLPNLLETMDLNLRQFGASDATPTLKTQLATVARDIRRSVGLAIRYARARINEAQKRLLDEKSPNRSLSASEQRCYLALGEEIPNQMPFLTRSAAQGVNTNGLNEQALATAVAAGVAAVYQAQGQIPAPQPTTTPTIPMSAPTGIGNSDLSQSSTAEFTTPNFEVEESDIDEAESVRYCAATTAGGGQCSKKALDGSDFCGHAAHNK
jgi:hypothetical protein